MEFPFDWIEVGRLRVSWGEMGHRLPIAVRAYRTSKVPGCVKPALRLATAPVYIGVRTCAGLAQVRFWNLNGGNIWSRLVTLCALGHSAHRCDRLFRISGFSRWRIRRDVRPDGDPGTFNARLQCLSLVPDASRPCEWCADRSRIPSHALEISGRPPPIRIGLVWNHHIPDVLASCMVDLPTTAGCLTFNWPDVIRDSSSTTAPATHLRRRIWLPAASRLPNTRTLQPPQHRGARQPGEEPRPRRATSAGRITCTPCIDARAMRRNSQ